MRGAVRLMLSSMFALAALQAAADGPAQDAADAYTGCLTAHATDTGNRSSSSDKVDPEAVKADCASEREALRAFLSPEQQANVFSTLDANIPKVLEDIAEAAGK